MISIKRTGFSLIELMIVIVIIAILTGFAALEVRREIKNAQEQTLKSNLKVLREQIDNFYADRGYYPTNLDDLTKGKYPYFASLPEDPTTKLVDWQVRPPKVNVARNVGDTFGASPPPHASADSSYITSALNLQKKFQTKLNENPTTDWDDGYDEVAKINEFDLIYGKSLDEEIYTDGTFTNFIKSLQLKTNFEDKQGDEGIGQLSEEAYAIVYDDVANLVRASPSQAIDGDLKTYWITEKTETSPGIFSVVSFEENFVIELKPDDEGYGEIKVESIVIHFHPPPDSETKYHLEKVEVNPGGEIMNMLTETIIASKNNNYTIAVVNPFREEGDTIDYVSLSIRAVDGVYPRPAIAEIMVFQAPFDKPKLSFTGNKPNFRWDVWRNCTPPGGVSDVKSNNASFSSW